MAVKPKAILVTTFMSWFKEIGKSGNNLIVWIGILGQYGPVSFEC